MIEVSVSLPSGRQTELSIHGSDSVASLLMLAQDFFACRLQLATQDGVLLTDLSASLDMIGLEAGGHVSCCALPIVLAAIEDCCASIGGTVDVCVVYEDDDMPPGLRHVARLCRLRWRLLRRFWSTGVLLLGAALGLVGTVRLYRVGRSMFSVLSRMTRPLLPYDVMEYSGYLGRCPRWRGVRCCCGSIV